MAFDTSDPTYQELRARVLASPAQVVPFVGPGATLYDAPSRRIPLPNELIERVLAEGLRFGVVGDADAVAISAAVQHGRYIEALDRALYTVGEPTLRRVVERELEDRGKRMPPAIAELVAIDWSLIVTTNLDRLIARAYLERHGRMMRAITSLDSHHLAAAFAGSLVSSIPFLAQIHGTVDDRRSWRLTRSDYEMLFTEPAYVEALRHLFLRTVFFVGFGLHDDDFAFLLRTTKEIYPGGVGQFYALIPHSRRASLSLRQLIVAGLRPIFYDDQIDPDPSDPFNGHRAVYECLKDLADAWAAHGTHEPATLTDERVTPDHPGTTPYVFISYVREDERQVRQLESGLTTNGVEVWIDRDQLFPGVRWQPAIREAIRNGAFFLACFSGHSAARDRTYMNEELTIAVDEVRQRPADRAWFLPVLLRGGEVPARPIGGGETLRDIQYVDLQEDWGRGVRLLLAVIKQPAPRGRTTNR